MNSINIIEGNILLYSNNISEIIKEVRTVLNINCKQLEFDDNLKYYKNIVNKTIKEYVFSKTIKHNLITDLINELVENNTNSLNLLLKKKYIIFHNFHYVNETYFKQFKLLFTKMYNTAFIFTSNKQIVFLQSFFLTKFIKHIETDYNNNNEINIRNECKNIISCIYKPYKSINFLTIRQLLYKLLFLYHDTSIILNKLSEIAIIEKPNQSNSIINYASEVDKMIIHGNKDIIYLEHFILLLINNDNI